MRFQHVSAVLEALDSSFVHEIAQTGGSQLPLSARWETWMSPSASAGMTRALVELRKSLDELCGATARAGWIVDTWSAYQDGMLDGEKESEARLGSAAIDGVEIGTEAEVKKNGAQAPIGQPTPGRGRTLSMQHEAIEIPERTRTPTVPNGRVVPALPVTAPLRPPPGLRFPSVHSSSSGQSLSNGDTMNGGQYLPSVTPIASFPYPRNETHAEFREFSLLTPTHGAHRANEYKNQN